VLVPRIQLMLEQFRALKALFLMDETFEGRSLRAAWASAVFDVKHRRNFEKIAIVGAPKWEVWCIRAAARWLMTGELRTFRLDQFAQARE
jgi:SpoIIAA-like